MTSLPRLIAAPFTPFDSDGTLRPETIPEQAQKLRTDGVAGAFVCGTTGEGGSLPLDERQLVAETWSAAAGGLDIIVHVGHACLADARRLAAHAERLPVAAIAAVPPYYHRAGDLASLVDFCARIAEAAPSKPFFYYHIPSLTYVTSRMDEFLLAARDRIPTFAGIKYTHNDLVELGRCLELAGDEQEIFYGRDETLLAGLALGARSAVGSTYNFAAPLYAATARALANGDLDTARRGQGAARRMIEIGSRYGGLPAFKALAGMLGPDCGPCRPPLRTLDPDRTERLRAELTTDGFFEALESAPR